MKNRRCDFVLLILGAVLVMMGLTVGLYGPTFLGKLYKKELALSPTSTSFKLWRQTPLPLYFEVYLFNMTNAEEFVKDHTVVPHFEEVGPFVFREVHERVNVVWNDNYTVTYNQTRNWTFIPEISQDPSVMITNLNVIATVLSQYLKKYPFLKYVINFEFNHFEKLTTTSSAMNWMFNGIDDKLWNELVRVEELLQMPVYLKQFAWFYGRNMSSSYDGIFTVRTGADDIFSVGYMDKWNHMTETDYYDGECGVVKGTSGELFPPVEDMDDNITIFVSDICSTLTLSYNESSSVEGIYSHKYVATKLTLDNGQFDPDNKCYCKGKCPAYGARNVSKCRMGAPLFFSLPHYYLADESYTAGISGMRPNQSEHEFIIQLDPLTGIPTLVRAQLQINVLLESVPWLDLFKQVPRLYIPMIWFRQRATITQDLAYEILLFRFIPPSIIGIGYVLLAVGLCIGTARLYVIWRRRHMERDVELLIPPHVDDDDDMINPMGNSPNAT